MYIAQVQPGIHVLVSTGDAADYKASFHPASISKTDRTDQEYKYYIYIYIYISAPLIDRLIYHELGTDHLPAVCRTTLPQLQQLSHTNFK